MTYLWQRGGSLARDHNASCSRISGLRKRWPVCAQTLAQHEDPPLLGAAGRTLARIRLSAADSLLPTIDSVPTNGTTTRAQCRSCLGEKPEHAMPLDLPALRRLGGGSKRQHAPGRLVSMRTQSMNWLTGVTSQSATAATNAFPSPLFISPLANLRGEHPSVRPARTHRLGNLERVPLPLSEIGHERGICAENSCGVGRVMLLRAQPATNQF